MCIRAAGQGGGPRRGGGGAEPSRWGPWGSVSALPGLQGRAEEQSISTKYQPGRYFGV